MSISIDLFTIYVITALASLVFGLIQLVVWAAGGFDRWPGWWGVGNVVVGLSGLSIFLRSDLSPFCGIAITNFVSVVGCCLVVQGFRIFVGDKPRWLIFGTVTAAAAGPLLFSYSPSEFTPRIAYICLIRATCDAIITALALRLATRERLRTAWILTALFAPTVVLFVGRAYLALTGELGAVQFTTGNSLSSWLVAAAAAFAAVRGPTVILLVAECSHKKIADIALRDALTGAMNRAGLNIFRSSLFGVRTFALIDMDNFKLLNDRHGHASGDAALCLLSAIGTEVVGGRGAFIRLGGDEFLAIIDGRTTDVKQDLNVLRASFAERIQPIAPDMSSPTLSIGIATGCLSDETLEAILQRADDALYEAKRRGKNQVGESRLAA